MAAALPVSKISTNNGQIPGLPRNPRFIRDERFDRLVKSIKDCPEMLELREVLVYEHEGSYVVIGGNMRFLACKKLGYKQVPAKIIPPTLSIEKLREIAIKDNGDFGEHDWDALANEWGDEPLVDWGIQAPGFENDFQPNLDPQTSTRKVSAEDVSKTAEELAAQHQHNGGTYNELVCPHCSETFFLRTEQ